MRRTIVNRKMKRIIALRLGAIRKGLSESQAMDLWGQVQAQARELSSRRLSRRQAMGLLGVGLGSGLASCVARRQGELASGSKVPSPNKPILVVGAGLAGLTLAYRLGQRGFKVFVCEAANRCGGRVFTERGFNASSQFVELGAELVDSSNTMLRQLAEELGLRATPFSSDAVHADQELFYFDGQFQSGTDFYRALGPMLRVVAADQKAIFGSAAPFFPTYKTSIGQGLLAADKTPLSTYFSKLSNHTEPWVIRALSLAYETEYGGALEHQSALNFLSLADTDLGDGFAWYGASDEWGRIQGGNSGICEQLVAKMPSQVQILLNHRLEAAHHDGQRFTFSFRVQEGSNTKSVTLQAEQAVLALPFSVLRTIDGAKPLIDQMSPRKQRSIREFSYGSNAKHMTSYKSRYWRTSRGASRCPRSQAAVLSDLKTGQYWETSRAQPGLRGSVQDSDHGILTNFLGGERGAEVHTRSKEHEMQILADVNTLWPGCSKEHDQKSVLKAWANEPLALGSYSSPAPGQYTSFLGVESEAECQGRLHFISEHTSQEWLGYMEGAVESAHRAAQAIVAAALAPVR
jgi:monoamine oxidase